MNVVFLNRIDDSRYDFLDVCRAEEVHQMQRQLLKSLCIVLVLVYVFRYVQVCELIQHVGDQDLISDLETSPQDSDITLTNIQEQLGQKSCLSTTSGPRNYSELSRSYAFGFLIEERKPGHLRSSVDLLIDHFLLDCISQSTKSNQIIIWYSFSFMKHLANQRWALQQKVICIFEFCNRVTNNQRLFQTQFLSDFRRIQYSSLVVIHPQIYFVEFVEIWQENIWQIRSSLRQRDRRISCYLIHCHRIKFSLSNHENVVRIFDQVIAKKSFSSSSRILSHILFGFLTRSSHFDFDQFGPIVVIGKISIIFLFKRLKQLLPSTSGLFLSIEWEVDQLYFM